MAILWPCRVLLRRWRLRGATQIVLVVFLVQWLIVCFSQTGPPAPSGTPSTPSLSVCRHVYRLGSVRYREEAAPSTGDTCLPPPLTGPLLRRCVERRARRRRRPTSILLLGDSRLRNLYQHLAQELDVPTPPEDSERYPDWQRGIHWTNSPERWCRVCPWHCCPRAAAAAGASLRFEWRPFWTDATVTELEAAAESCESGHRDCPDLVLVNGALWYMKAMLKVNAWSGDTAQLLLLLRAQLARAAAALTRLAFVTRTIWKLDEGTPSDVHLMLHSASPAEIPVVHSLVYDVARKIPGLTVWSSALPESTGFLRHTCYSMQGRQDPVTSDDSTPAVLVNGRPQNDRVSSNRTFIRECGKEALHLSEAVMSRAVRTMFAEFCSEEGESAMEGREATREVLETTCCSRNILEAT
ncbi:hypothetical protein FJT64_017821 [Amphibalanus amphitrite]|uniref:Uncharacterized protein n=1 Tax=Amphibalanus amphitrite TaxID=1232801 RepID=A0A6A4X8J1_AMPAM|nr:hypothetical protein FJT64_017821 [Amphibalanus amphitrite]